MILIIAKHELKTLFLSPLAWVILGVVQTLLGFIFIAQVENFLMLQPQLAMLRNTPGVTDIVIASLFQISAIILLTVMPLVTMRSIAEEKRNRTLSLLMSSPISMSEIVLGKFLGLLGFVVILVSLLMLMPLSLFSGTSLDGGKLTSIFIAMLLLLSAFAAIGLYLSSLTENQTIAAVSTFGVLLMLWIVDATLADSHSVVAYLSLLRHHQNLLDGIIDSADIVYYLLQQLSILWLHFSQGRSHILVFTAL